MRVVYAPRAAADLREIGVQSRRAFGAAVAAALETYVRATVARIAVMPESGQRLPARPVVRVVPLVRYPFKICAPTMGRVVPSSLWRVGVAIERVLLGHHPIALSTWAAISPRVAIQMSSRHITLRATAS